MDQSIAAVERHPAVLRHERGKVGERPRLDAVEVRAVIGTSAPAGAADVTRSLGPWTWRQQSSSRCRAGRE